MILKKSPLLAVFFSVSLVCSMFYLVPMCFEYYFAFLISIIASIIVMRNLNREDEFYFITDRLHHDVSPSPSWSDL